MDDLISRQTVLEMAYDMSEIDGEHFTEPCMVVDVEDIQKLPSVTQKSETVTEFADRCRECGAKYGKLLKQEPCGDLISRVEAIKAIDEKAKRIKNADTLNGLAGAVGILFDLPSVKPQPCEDTVSRQAVLDIDFYRIIHTTANPSEMIRQKIEQLPPVTPQPKTGHWINISNKDLYDYRTGNKLCFECSECRSQYTYKSNYCPNCGMVEPQERSE